MFIIILYIGIKLFLYEFHIGNSLYEYREVIMNV